MLRRHQILSAGILLSLILPFRAAAEEVPAPASKPKNVLILYGERLDLPAIRLLEKAFADRLGAARQPAVNVFAEYFDFARFPAAENDALLTAYLRDRYHGRNLDLVMPVSGLALDFASRHRDELFPGVPMVFTVLDPKEVDAAKLPADVTGVAARVDVRRTLELALRLQPNAREIVVISGASDLDKRVLAEATTVLDALSPRVPWRAVAGRSLPETIAAVQTLPRDVIVLVLSVARDGEGRPRSIPEVTRQLVPVSRAPVYGLAGTILGAGAVGGALIDFSDIGRKASDLAMNALGGRWIAYGSPEMDTRNPLVVDWRALELWNLPAAALPPDAVVMFRDPTLWERRGGAILAVLAVGLVQSATITGLLVQRRRRRRSEEGLRESESQMSLAAQAANLGFWARDMSDGKIWATEKCLALHGFPANAEVSYEDFFSRLHPEDREPTRQSIESALAAQSHFDAPYRVLFADGSQRWIGATGKAEYGPDGHATRLLGVCLDLTARRRAEDETHDLRQKLAHSSRVTMLGQLASALAHELSQPLGAILRNAEAAELFLKMPTLDAAEITAILADVHKDTQRAAGVIDRMRSMLRRRELHSEILRVPALVAEVTALIREDAATRGVVIHAEMPAGLAPVRGDRVQFQQVLLNLILNGMDALADATESERRVTIRANDTATGAVEIAVSDTGPGISPADMGKLFDPFFTTRPHGLGVGLAISRSIIEAHGGRLWAENNPTRGATFRITLPAAAEEAGE